VGGLKLTLSVGAGARGIHLLSEDIDWIQNAPFPTRSNEVDLKPGPLCFTPDISTPAVLIVTW
jgi:hypothetical protein